MTVINVQGFVFLCQWNEVFVYEFAALAVVFVLLDFNLRPPTCGNQYSLLKMPLKKDSVKQLVLNKQTLYIFMDVIKQLRYLVRVI